MDPHRTQRVSEAVREELSEIIGFELDDPRLTGVYVTGVEVGPGLRHASIMIAAQGGEREQNLAMKALDHARNYLRKELARRLNLRKVPELHFRLDTWVEAPQRVEILLQRAKKTRGMDGN